LNLPSPAAVTKHGRPAVVVLAIEEYERLKALDKPPATAGIEDTKA
jgi:PHD/YefM family antitoxin component YafN of YafNO toxin-antitoxin module